MEQLQLDIGDIVRLDVTGYTYSGCLAEVLEPNDSGHHRLRLTQVTEDASDSGRKVGFTFTTSTTSDTTKGMVLISTPETEALTIDPNFKLVNDFNMLLRSNT